MQQLSQNTTTYKHLGLDSILVFHQYSTFKINELTRVLVQSSKTGSSEFIDLKSTLYYLHKVKELWAREVSVTISDNDSPNKQLYVCLGYFCKHTRTTKEKHREEEETTSKPSEQK